MAIHDLDMSRFLMGEEPVEIFATGSCMIDQVTQPPKNSARGGVGNSTLAGTRNST
jgi:predicted dehydrogenase